MGFTFLRLYTVIYVVSSIPVFCGDYRRIYKQLALRLENARKEIIKAELIQRVDDYGGDMICPECVSVEWRGVER